MRLNTLDIVWGHSGRAILLTLLTISGVRCVLDISPGPGPTLVNAKVGSNVTLAVSISGAEDPVVQWSMDSLPVVTWTIGSTISPPDIADSHKGVLKLEVNGSLTFVNVQLGYSNNYTIEITKAGLGTASAIFTLKVYELIQNVTVYTEPEYAVEEESISFTLYYRTVQGEPEQWTWYFNRKEIKDSSHYSVKQKSLVISQPNRSDTGLYSLNLRNPYSNVTTNKDVTVRYGPDEPRVVVSPEEPFYVSGDCVNLSCQSEGFPVPSVDWLFGGQVLSSSHKGFLNLTNLQASHQGGVYTCMLLNEQTGKRRQRNVTINVYERPTGSPLCSVHSVPDNSDLQYKCQWPGGTPKALLSFPALANGSSGAAEFSLTVPASQELSGKTVTCFADHPLQQNSCNVTARSPMAFLPMVSSTIEMNGKILVTIQCISQASPTAVISWSKGNESLTNGIQYEISTDTTQLGIRDFNISSFLLENYTCTCTNPLGSQTRDTRLQGPTISDSSLFPNQDRTIITLTWEVPPTSVVTGFAIQMKGPDLIDTKNVNQAQTKGASRQFETIQQKPGSTRSTDISTLDPKSTYRFRIIPLVGRTTGEPSDVHRIGPGEGLTGPAIAGIAAGIPCSLLFIVLLISLIYLCVTCYKKKGQQRSYPKSNVVKAVATHTPPDIMLVPHDLLTGGLKPPPDYNRLHQSDSSERSIPLPTFVPPPPVRFATTV